MIFNKKYLFRIFLIILFLIPICKFNEIYQHFYTYLTGNIITNVIVDKWNIVLLNIILFSLFLVPLSFRRKVNWKEYGLVTAFFVSLFVEMYGIPLSILFASKYFFNPIVNLPKNILEINFLGINFGMDFAMFYGLILMLTGAFLIMLGWIKLYMNRKKDLVTTGIYSFSRHPQYLGFILIILGWFIGWPTILTLIFSPILIYKYILTSKNEEREISKKNKKYLEYKEKVPFFI